MPDAPNGLIDNYTIVYVEVRTNMQRSVTAGVIPTMFNLTGLMEYERYEVTVTASTDKGPGDQSDTLDVLTEEHCKLVMGRSCMF